MPTAPRAVNRDCGAAARTVTRAAGHAALHPPGRRLTLMGAHAYPARTVFLPSRSNDETRYGKRDAMARLEEATERLNAAIDRLERVVAGRPAGRSDENEALRSELAEARERSGALREASSTASARLDAVIDRLKHVLET